MTDQVQEFAVGSYVFPKGEDPKTTDVFRVIRSEEVRKPGTFTIQPKLEVRRVLKTHTDGVRLRGHRATWWRDELEAMPEMLLLARVAKEYSELPDLPSE